MTIEKIILKKKYLNYKNYTVFGFLAIVIAMLPLIFFFWKISPEAYLLKNLFVFFLIIFFSILANLFTFVALKRENLTILEPIRLMQPLFTILLAFIMSFFFQIYYLERNYSILILGIVASTTLVLSHVQKHHLIFDKYITSALLGSLFLAAIVRMFANIGQMIFDLKANNLKANDLKANTEKLVKIAGSLDKTGQDIREIKDFFEKIENRLDLKK